WSRRGRGRSRNGRCADCKAQVPGSSYPWLQGWRWPPYSLRRVGLPNNFEIMSAPPPCPREKENSLCRYNLSTSVLELSSLTVCSESRSTSVLTPGKR